jgi:hypothetical protein
MRHSGCTPAAVVLDSRQQRFAARLANACEGSKLKKLYDHPTSGSPICRVVKKEHECGRTTEAMCWPDPREEPAVKPIMLDDDTAAMRVAKRRARTWQAKLDQVPGCGGQTDFDRMMEE